eukprot:GHVN01028175.1.p1 GENE.GHVN01028175.1~~GHVN01028175.1.p1  ORF type:complete len:285 (+),score=87.33 GHVN01028175.1:2457-3311(+)
MSEQGDSFPGRERGERDYQMNEMNEVNGDGEMNEMNELNELNELNEVKTVIKVSEVKLMSETCQVREGIDVCDLNELSDVNAVSDVSDVSHENTVSKLSDVSEVNLNSLITPIEMSFGFDDWRKIGKIGKLGEVSDMSDVGNVNEVSHVRDGNRTSSVSELHCWGGDVMFLPTSEWDETQSLSDNHLKEAVTTTPPMNQPLISVLAKGAVNPAKGPIETNVYMQRLESRLSDYSRTKRQLDRWHVMTLADFKQSYGCGEDQVTPNLSPQSPKVPRKSIPLLDWL